jgi:hypothetical protein
MSKLAILDLVLAAAIWPFAFIQVKAANFWVAGVRPDNEFIIYVEPMTVAMPIVLGLLAVALGWILPMWRVSIHVIVAAALVLVYAGVASVIWASAAGFRT